MVFNFYIIPLLGFLCYAGSSIFTYANGARMNDLIKKKTQKVFSRRAARTSRDLKIQSLSTTNDIILESRNHTTKRVKKGGRGITKLLVPLIIGLFILIGTSAVLYPDIKQLVRNYILRHSQIEGPLEILIKDKDEEIEALKTRLLSGVADWNLVFQNDPTQTPISTALEEDYETWSKSKLEKAMEQINKQVYDEALSEEDIEKLKKERNKILNERILPYMKLADPSLITCGIGAVSTAINHLEQYYTIKLTDLRNFLAKFDGTKRVEKPNITPTKPLEDALNTVGIKYHNIRANIFISSIPTTIDQLVALNNMLVPFNLYINAWLAQINKPDRELLQDISKFQLIQPN